MLAKDLPIYKVTYELLEKVTKLTKNYRKDLKQNLGNKIVDNCTELVLNIYRANSSKQPEKRRKYIHQLFENLQVLELSIKLSYDLQLISAKQHGEIVELTDNIGRQAKGWLKNSYEKSQNV